MFLNPKTAKKGGALSASDIAIRTAQYSSDPEELFLIYIQDGIAKVATTPRIRSAANNWTYEYDVGAAIDVAIEFNMFWEINSQQKYRPITYGDPWLFTVTPTFQLTAKYGELGTPTVLCASGVMQVTSIRGWKNVRTGANDQGIVVAYVKNDGTLWCRSYCEQENGTWLWESEKQVPGTPAGITRVTMFRSNDFRIGFLIEASGVIHMILTAKTWAGLGIAEAVYVQDAGLSITLTQVSYKDISSPTERISVVNSSISIGFGSTETTNSFTHISNTDAYTVSTGVAIPINNIDRLDFKFMDSLGKTFPISGITADAVGKELVLTMVDINNAFGQCTLKFLGGIGTSSNMVGVPFAPFEISFTPTGLVPTQVPMPKVVRVFNGEVFN